MNKNTLQNVINFIFKYIWIFCAILIFLELIGTLYTGVLIMERTAQNVLTSVNGEVSGRVSGVLQLLQGVANDKRISDTDVPLFDRAVLLEPYRESYDLFMMALTDENVNVISSDATEEPTESYSLAYRDYMQELYQTGDYQITNAMAAGSDGVTMNYTIAVPIMKDEKVAGSVFGSIYFQDIEDILKRNSIDLNHTLLLLGDDQVVMGSEQAEFMNRTFDEIADNATFFGVDREDIKEDIRTGSFGDVWEWGTNGFSYVVYDQVDSTGWTIVYRISFMAIIYTLLPALVLKIGCYIALCAMIFIFGRRYMNNHLASVNHLIDQVTVMQKELFQSEQTDYDHLLELTQQGLIDHLTGLSTRGVLLRKMDDYLKRKDAQGAVMFVDLDDLKHINDHYGHEAGDLALIHFADVLKAFEKQTNGIAARYGGDEFIFVIPNMEQKEVIAIANDIGNALRSFIVIKEHNIKIHGSIGIALYPNHGISTEELICKADLALYEAKQDGKDQYYCYESKDVSKFGKL